MLFVSFEHVSNLNFQLHSYTLLQIILFTFLIELVFDFYFFIKNPVKYLKFYMNVNGLSQSESCEK